MKTQEISPDQISNAVAAYEMVTGMLQMLTLAQDESAAKNYVEITLEGALLPFDRICIAFVRPGGLTPHQARLRAEALSLSLAKDTANG